MAINPGVRVIPASFRVWRTEMINVVKRRWKQCLGLLFGVSLPSVGLSQQAPVQVLTAAELAGVVQQSVPSAATPARPGAQPGLRSQPAASVGPATTQPTAYVPQAGG